MGDTAVDAPPKRLPGDFSFEPVDHDPFEDAHGTGPQGNVADSLMSTGSAALLRAREALTGPQPTKEQLASGEVKIPSWQSAIPQAFDLGMQANGIAPAAMPGIFTRALTGEGKLATATRPPGQTFYHASPHDFDKFDSSKIGTGEGAQAYGHGLYVAENPDVAREYRKDFQKHNGKAITYEGTIDADPDHFLHWDKPLSEQSDHVKESLEKAGIPGYYADDPIQQMTGEDAHSELVGYHRADIEDDLDTQDKLAKQIPATLSPKQAEAKLAMLQEGEAQKRAADQMKDAGIAGIKYMDRDSKTNALAISNAQKRIQKSKDAIASGQTTTEGGMDHESLINSAANRLKYLQGHPLTHNYVIFNDKILNIVKKYGMAGLIAAGHAHFTTTQTDEDPFNAHSSAAEPSAP